MSDYKIQKVMIGGVSYTWDYNSLIGLPDFYSKLQGGHGIDIQTDPETGQLYVSMSSTVSQDIDRLLASVFPVKVEITGTTGIGNFEIGTSVDPKVQWNLTGTYNSYYIIPSYKTPTGSWVSLSPDSGKSGFYEFKDTETDRSYKIAFRIDDSYTIEIGPFETKFLKPRYYGQVLGEPSEITQSLIESLSDKEISESPELENTSVKAGRCFIFAVPGIVNLRSYAGSGFLESRTGMISLRKGTKQYVYTWIATPVSGIDWELKIVT